MAGSIISIALEGARLNALLVAAIELHLCDHLATGPATAAELARRAGASERGCQAVADGMVALKLWRVSNGVYSNTALAESSLVSTAPDYVGEEQPGLFRAWLRRFERISETVRTGEPPYSIDSPETLQFWSLLTPVLARRGRAVPEQAFSLLDLSSGPVHLADIGGGAGALFSHALLESHSSAQATQVDWPHINEAARARIRTAGLGDRFHTIDGDFHTVDLGADRYDVAVLSHIVHQESGRSTVEILRRVARSLREGGRLVVVDWIADDGRTGPASALVFNLTMLLLSDEGKSYERRELAGLFAEGGFSEPSFHATEDMSVIAIAARR